MVIRGRRRKAAQDDVSNAARFPRQFRSDHANRDARGPIGRKTVNPGGYGRKRDRYEPVRGGEIKGGAIARGQQFVLPLAAAAPDRADRMDHMLGRKPVAACDLGAAGFAAAKRSAFGKQLRSGGAMNGPIHPAAAEQRAIRRIDDNVERKRRDVGNATSSRAAPILADSNAFTSVMAGRAYHAHSACASVRRSTVLFTPISSKCSSRKRRAARLPLVRSISKKS